ncbi:MAG: c-type cytochrome, partial [Gammaproteobacteria bacterium]|nr:c-type cytochrome [Gammaproteobacteria bacterium]
MNASRRGAWVRGIATVALGLAAAAASGANVVAACGRCHGTGGEGRSAGAVPRIAGLPARYLAEQLEAFAAGRRPDPAMRSIAQALSASQRRAVAARYASLGPPSATSSTPSAAAPAGTAATRLAPAAAAVARGVLDGADAKGLIDGARLAMRGRWRTGVPACMQCHGPRGEGVGERFPPLVGQPREYLAAQLRAWRGGARWPGPLGLMAGVAGGLTEGQIEDVAAYFSAPESSRRAARALALELHASGREFEAPTAASAASPPPFAPPRWGDEPEGAFGRSVLAGERIFLDPRRYAPAYARAAIRCSGCHLDAGRRAGSAPLWAAFVAYPAYRRRGHR